MMRYLGIDDDFKKLMSNSKIYPKVLKYFAKPKLS